MIQKPKDKTASPWGSWTTSLDTELLLWVWGNCIKLFSRKSESTITNVCLFLCLSSKPPSSFNLQPSSFILWLLSFTACYINFGIRRFHDSFSSMYLIVGFIKSNWSFIKVCFHFTAIIKLQFHFKIFAKQPYKREDKHNTLQKYILIQYELLLGPFDWL